jgi:uncharacterized protein
MSRFFGFLLLALAVGLGSPAAAADGIPARPEPFTFVTDQANLLSAADAKKLEGGLRKYADNTGTQVVVVTVPSLNGTKAADYARQLGTAWGVGQRDKNNGIVVLLSGKEHQMSIEAGSGLRSAITPELTQRVMSQDMAPAFKQGNYFAGLRKGLNTLMQAANPSSAPHKDGAAASSTTPASAANADATTTANSMGTASTEPAAPAYPAAEPAPASSGGLGIGSLLIGALVIGGGIFLVKRLFSRSNNNAAQSATPDFRGNGPVAGNQTPNFMGNNQGYPQGGGYGGQAPSSGPGIGGMLATGAAAAAGAYLGNRMSESHDNSGSAAHNFDAGTAGAAGAAGAVPPANAASDYFGTSNSNSGTDAGPDYFSDNTSSDNSGDYFSGDGGSYDDTSSDDTGGGGFDSTDDNQGSW